MPAFMPAVRGTVSPCSGFCSGKLNFGYFFSRMSELMSRWSGENSIR